MITSLLLQQVAKPVLRRLGTAVGAYAAMHVGADSGTVASAFTLIAGVGFDLLLRKVPGIGP